jgi:AraC-like DNA-binding protein
MNVEQQLSMLRFSVPVPCVKYMLIVSEKNGVSADQLLVNTELVVDDIYKKDARIATWQKISVASNLLQLTQKPNTSIEVGLMTRLVDLGLMGYGLMSSATVRDAVEFLVNFMVIRTPFIKLDFESKNDQAIITIQETFPLTSPFRCFFLECGLIEICQIFRTLPTGKLSDPYRQNLHINFDFPEPAYFAAYKDVLPRLRFNQPKNQIIFSTSLLNFPIRTANSAVNQLIINQCEVELTKLGHANNWLSRVRTLLVCRNGQYPDLSKIACELHVSERTLKRKLSEFKISYSNLLDNVRLQDACNLLETTELNIDDIALRLGYRDPANFTRAFRRWLGTTPSQYRKDAKV